MSRDIDVSSEKYGNYLTYVYIWSFELDLKLSLELLIFASYTNGLASFKGCPRLEKVEVVE